MKKKNKRLRLRKLVKRKPAKKAVKRVAKRRVRAPRSHVSFAVCYVRPRDINSDGSVSAHRLNPSPRRFATEREAFHHGGRFVQIERHRGCYVIQTSDRVNAHVNWKTGKTNPLIGRRRTNR